MHKQVITKLKRGSKWLDNHLAFAFVCIASVAGLYFVFRVTPLFNNDEIVHYPRTYYIQEGHLNADHLGGYDYGGLVPKQIKQFNDAYREQIQSSNTDENKLREIKDQYNHERLQDDGRETLSFTSASLSAGWGYAAPAAGIFTARIMHLPLNWYVYLGRLFTLIVYIVLTYFAIRYIPIAKRLLFMVALLPTTLLQGTTIGLDGLVNGISWLIIALTFAVLARKLLVTPWLLAVLAALCALLATSKQGYMPLAALPLLIPARLFPFNLKNVWIWRVVFGTSLLIVSLWYLGATSPIAEVIHHVQRPGLYIDEGSQLHYIFQHPLQFLGMIFIQPFSIWSASIYGGIVGILTNKQIWLPIPIILLLYLIIFMTSLHKERPFIAGRDRIYVLVSSIFTFLATFSLINLALYLSFTIVGFDHVEGLQGRYFLPLLPLLGIILHTAMPRYFLKVSDMFMNVLTYPTILLALVISAIAVT